jgi:cytochrome c biogenesis protein CcdA/glutaredoxin
MGKLFWYIITVFWLLSSFQPLFATTAEEKILDANIPVIEFSIFSRPDCVHCIELKKFLDVAYPAWSRIQPRYYDINTPENNALYQAFTSGNNLSRVTPIILIWNEIIEWYGWSETTGKFIQETAKNLTKSSLFEEKTSSFVKHVWGDWCSLDAPCVAEPRRLDVNLPFIWVINLREYSLPLLASLLGFVDWFNPCAMWVLVMFLTILMQTGSRKKMFQIAGIFILAEAIMYFMILNVWYKTWDFVKLDQFITPIIGIISFAAGAYFIYEFFTNKDGECKVTSFEHKKKTTEKIREIVNKPMTVAVFFATIGIAFSVNVIEFACSIGIPQAFTKLLEMSTLDAITKQIYILIYTFFYMFDDFIVFGIALYAFHYLHLTTKYTRYCLAIGWIIMIILGYFFLFDPVALKMIIA